MRELKFRLFDKADGIHFMNDQMSYFDGYLPENDATAVMQYTGLKDKNGNEIYEGDIITLDRRESFITFDWDGSGYSFEDGAPISDFCDIEVVGNIYENPELIQYKK